MLDKHAHRMQQVERGLPVFDEWEQSDFTLPVCPTKIPVHFLFSTFHILIW